MRKYWLLKSEPSEFSFQDLKACPNQTACWDGVRNYQARNFMRDSMQVGDWVLFYHSGKRPAIVGTATVVKAGYPDHSAWDPTSKHHDPRSSPESPVWFMVDIRYEDEFQCPLALAVLRKVEGLEHMMLLRKGSRLSVQPVAGEEFERILAMAQSVSKPCCSTGVEVAD